MHHFVEGAGLVVKPVVRRLRPRGEGFSAGSTAIATSLAALVLEERMAGDVALAELRVELAVRVLDRLGS